MCLNVLFFMFSIPLNKENDRGNRGAQKWFIFFIRSIAQQTYKAEEDDERKAQRCSNKASYILGYFKLKNNFRRRLKAQKSEFSWI